MIWGLAVAGETGVAEIINLLKEELSTAMALSGCARLEDIDSSLVICR
ncbi:alpha-hydroxy-acid oxidizing protein [Sphaerospermopsis torques-reginae]|uniref:Alpha-hydroxy-acid oxidizing protein n=1 Tax=Sphaerospermopsis torques-reginae ITEP-024 TaxID=984208 RepID=A0ABX8X1M9_9CYAN|nr:alpha-hydroxy-acid oxidizing protein [Sphaerospermopsis torques-reginae ITEP-024]